mgnify:CR=1 FL=1
MDTMQKKIQIELKRLEIPIEAIHPEGELTDAEIILGGTYDGLTIQVGADYYGINREVPEGIVSVHGSGDLKTDILEAIRFEGGEK